MKNTALLIIDMQNDFVLENAPAQVKGALKTVPVIKNLLNFFREKKFPIFHIYREYREDGSDIEIVRYNNFINKQKYCIPGTKGAEIIKDLKPIKGEYKIVKNRFSAFMNTELDFILRRLKIDHLIISGTQYPNCIRCTAFDAISYGYQTTIITDATSAQTDEIAQNNILDMENIGIECITFEEFIKKAGN